MLQPSFTLHLQQHQHFVHHFVDLFVRVQLELEEAVENAVLGKGILEVSGDLDDAQEVIDALNAVVGGLRSGVKEEEVEAIEEGGEVEEDGVFEGS